MSSLTKEKNENDKLSWNGMDISTFRFIEDKIYDEVVNDDKIDMSKIYTLRDTSDDFNKDISRDILDYEDEDILQNALRKTRHIIRLLNLPTKPVKVKIRKNGITSCGLPNDCHYNVAYFVKKFGGRRVAGYLLESQREDTQPVSITNIQTGDTLRLPILDGHEKDIRHSIYHHSVWETPEGKLVDVTNKGYGTKSEFVYFLPLSYLNPSVEHHIIDGDFDCWDNVHRGVRFFYHAENKYKTISWKRFKVNKKLVSDILDVHKLNLYKTGQYQDWVNKVLKFQSSLEMVA